MKQRSTHWVKKGSAQLKKVCDQKSQLKIMVITFWNQRVIIYVHYCPAGQTVNTAYYKKVITQLICAHILRKQLECQGGKWKLTKTIWRPHVSKVMLAFFGKKKIELMPHLAYSSYLVPSDVFLFPDVKKELKGRCFSSREEIIGTVHVILKRLSKNGFEILLEK